MVMRMITGGGVRLAIHETGRSDGQPLLFIHGFSQSHAAWSKQLQSSLAGRFRLVAFDLRGHGESEKPVDRYAVGDSWAGDVHAVISELALWKTGQGRSSYVTTGEEARSPHVASTNLRQLQPS